MNAGERGAREEIEKQKKALRTELDTQGVLTFENNDAIARWRAAVEELVQEGFAEADISALASEKPQALEVRRRGRAA